MEIQESSLRRVTVVTPDGVKHHRVPYLVLPSALRNYEELFGGTFTIYCVQQHSSNEWIDSGRPTYAEHMSKVLQEALEHHGFNKSATARALGISRTTLYTKIKTYGIKSKANAA